ncbi:hypothetical protein B0H65DRAFT_55111 [Neurospora tetraspora]|uniref:Uncharacterized protein n=1 Tax=Neurospora tetraspora TaxID=94610 RepID=A0AAE0JQL4_9PEZI|nr:hypothetical protein B0H65DRAFT_55111 [Neurospora tetraspora]
MPVSHTISPNPLLPQPCPSFTKGGLLLGTITTAGIRGGLRHGQMNAVKCAFPQHVSHPSMAAVHIGMMPTCPGRVKHVDMHAFRGKSCRLCFVDRARSTFPRNVGVVTGLHWTSFITGLAGDCCCAARAGPSFLRCGEAGRTKSGVGHDRQHLASGLSDGPGPLASFSLAVPGIEGMRLGRLSRPVKSVPDAAGCACHWL